MPVLCWVVALFMPIHSALCMSDLSLSEYLAGDLLHYHMEGNSVPPFSIHVQCFHSCSGSADVHAYKLLMLCNSITHSRNTSRTLFCHTLMFRAYICCSMHMQSAASSCLILSSCGYD